MIKEYLITFGEILHILKSGKIVYREDLPDTIYYKYEEGFIFECDAEADGYYYKINPEMDLSKYKYYILV